MSYSAEWRRESFISESDLALLGTVDLAALERSDASSTQPSTSVATIEEGSIASRDGVYDEYDEYEKDDERGYDSENTRGEYGDEGDGCENQMDGRRMGRWRSVIELVHESSRTRVYRIRGSSHRDGGDGGDRRGGEENAPAVNSDGGDTGGDTDDSNSDLAIKSLVDPTPPPELLSRLYNEHNVLTSDHLNGCPCIRRAVQKAKVDGCHALYLEWVRGVTVREWLRGRKRRGQRNGGGSLGNGKRGQLLEAAGLALRLAEALADIHSRGVRHNNVSANNIIVEQTKGQERQLQGLQEQTPLQIQPQSQWHSQSLSQPESHLKMQSDESSKSADFRVTFIDFALASLEESAAAEAAAAAACVSSNGRRRSSALPLPMRSNHSRHSQQQRDSLAAVGRMSATSSILAAAAAFNHGGTGPSRSVRGSGSSHRGSVSSHRGSVCSHRGSVVSHRGSVGTYGGIVSNHRGSVSSHRSSISSYRGSVVSHRGSSVSTHRGSISCHRGSVRSSRSSVSSVASHRGSSVGSHRSSLSSLIMSQPGGPDQNGGALLAHPPFELSLVIEEGSHEGTGHSRTFDIASSNQGGGGCKGRVRSESGSNSQTFEEVGNAGLSHEVPSGDTWMINVDGSLDDNDRDEEGSGYDEGVEGDLRRLGEVFGMIFSGDGDGIDNDDNGEDSAASASVAGIHADPNLLPRSLRAVVCDLTECDETDDDDSSRRAGRRRYCTAAEVADDLRWMVRDPDRFLFDPVAVLATGVAGMAGTGRTAPEIRLDLDPTRLYGREDEAVLLTEAYVRSCCQGETYGRKELVLVRGSSGTGKSTLVRTVFDRLAKGGQCGGQCGGSPGSHGSRSHYFVSGKFDRVCQGEPYSAVAEAFDELCGLVIAGDEDVHKEKLRRDVKEAIGSLSNVRDLATIMPKISDIAISSSSSSFSDVVCDGDEGSDVDEGDGSIHRKLTLDNKNAENRFKFLFRTFARAIATPDHPVVIFLDDCQWADAASLDLVRVLLTDTESSSILFVAAYTADETIEDTALIKVCDELEEEAGVCVTRLETGNLTVESTGSIISNATGLTPRVTWPLARIVHRKTQGNIFFMLQFLKKLRDESLLYFSHDAMTWVWDESQIESLDITDNVVNFLADTIVNKISSAAQHVLKVAACLGSHFTVSTIRVAVIPTRHDDDFNKDFDLIDTLEMAVEMGMLVATAKSGEYKFTHNRIHQAAYSLIPVEERASFHREIGEQLAKDPIVMERLIFVAVGQLNLGSSLVDDPADRSRLAQLNLKAAERAMTASAFSAAAGHLRAGLAAIKGSLWGDNHELSLRLFILLADIERCAGDFGEMELHLQEVFYHAHTMKEKLPAHISQIKSLGAQFKVAEAIDACYDVLAHYGMDMPKTVNKRTITVDFFRTKAALRGMSTDRIMSLPSMKDETTLASMELMDSVSVYAFITRPQHVPLIVFRMVRLSIKYGLCRHSALAFARFAWLLTAGGKNRKKARCFGQLALAIVERFRARELISSVHNMIYHFLSHWWEGVQLSIDPLFAAYRASLDAGNIEVAGICARSYALAALQSGRPLSPLEDDLRKFCHLLTENRQKIMLIQMCTLRQVILNLLGKSDDPTVLKGEAIDLPAILDSDRSRLSSGKCEFMFNNYTLQLAYLFGQHRLAANAAQKSREMSRMIEFNTRYIACSHAFYDGLNVVALAREEKSSWRGVAKGAMKAMKRWAKHTPQNCLNKILLLEAETAAIDGKAEQARTTFDKAIAAGCQYGFTQDVAVSYERAAIFLLENGNKEESLDYFSRARQFYLEWGAVAKVEHIDHQIARHFKRTFFQGGKLA